MKITIHCCLCDAKHETEIAMADGWQHRYDGIDDERNGFCPKHAPVAEFAKAQCPGCVGGWGDCPMWESFAYSGKRSVGAKDFEWLRQGVCPRRVNGTFGVSAGKIEDLNLSNQAPPACGATFAEAIEDYCKAYPV